MTTVQGIYGYQLELEPVSLSVAETAERVFANVVTANFFQVLGVPPSPGGHSAPARATCLEPVRLWC